MPPRARAVRKKNAVEVTLDHGNGSRVMRFRLPATTRSQATPSQAAPSQTASTQAASTQARDDLASATTSPSIEESLAPDDFTTSSVAMVRAAVAMQLLDTSTPLPPSMHTFRLASPENEFPSLLGMRGDEDEEGFVSEPDEQPPTTPRHPRVDRAPLCPPSAQSRNPVTPTRRLGQTPGRSHTSRRRTRYRDGPAGNKKRHAAKDVWEFFELNDNDRRECVLCESTDDQSQVKTFGKKTGSSNLREHLVDSHRNEWVKKCLERGLTIRGRDGLAAKAAYEAEQHGGYLTSPPELSSDDRPQFGREAFVDSLVEWIVADDQSINVIESRQLRKLILMLRPELRDHDIPHRTTIRKRVLEVLDEYIVELKSQLKKAMGRISLTTDIWSDLQLVAFMAVTAHWIEEKAEDTPDGARKKLTLRSALIGFHLVPKGHDGKQLAHILFSVVERVQILGKIGWITMDNASNNTTMMSAFTALLRARGIRFDYPKRHIR
ncbi:hypothetical protein V8E53_015705 [Lactarius tabidus]